MPPYTRYGGLFVLWRCHCKDLYKIPPQRFINKVPYKAVGWLSAKIRVVASRDVAFVLRSAAQKPKRFCKRRIFGQPQKGERIGETLAKRPPCSSQCSTVAEGQFLSLALLRPSGVKGAALHVLVPLPCSKGTAGRGPSGVLRHKVYRKHLP